MRMLKVFGWTLIIAAVLMHFTVCEWSDSGSRGQIILFIHAREQFGERSRNSYSGYSYKYNIVGAGFWGLVVPTVIAGTGIALIHHGQKD